MSAPTLDQEPKAVILTMIDEIEAADAETDAMSDPAVWGQ